MRFAPTHLSLSRHLHPPLYLYLPLPLLSCFTATPIPAPASSFLHLPLPPQYSLSYFTQLFNYCLEASAPSDDLTVRLETLLNFTTEFMYRTVCR